MMNTYFLCITQPYNLGDLVINKMLINELCKYGKVFVDVYKTPSDFSSYLLDNENAIDVYNIYGFSVKRLHLWPLLKLIRKEKIRVYTSSPGPLGKSGFIVGTVLKIIENTFGLSKVDYYSIGQCASMVSCNSEKISVSNYAHMYLRSKKSVDYINTLKKGLASYIPDLAFLLRQYISVVPSKRRICITFRDLKTPCFKEKCVKTILDCAEKGYEVVLFYQVKTDQKFMDDLYSSVSHPKVLYRKQLVWFRDIAFYSGASFVISNRLHALLLGMIYNAKPIAFVQDHSKTIKIRDVFESIFPESDLNCFYFNFESNDDIVRTFSNFENYDIGDICRIKCQECIDTIKSLADKYQ